MTTHITKRRTTKAALCGAAAFAMLLGGGSTYAAWSDQDELALDPVDISTGGWTFDLAESTEWYDVSPETGDSPVLIGSLADFPLVPGDVVKGVVSVDADLGSLVGTHLDATVGAVSVSSQPSTVSWLAASASVTGDAQVTVTIEFPYGATNDYGTQNGEVVAVDLGSLTVTVQQARPALDA